MVAASSGLKKIVDAGPQRAIPRSARSKESRQVK
jgi:hypothetical protein